MKKEKNGKVGVLKFWTWNFRTMSAGIQAVLIGYIVFYCTDVLELNAALVGNMGGILRADILFYRGKMRMGCCGIHHGTICI